MATVRRLPCAERAPSPRRPRNAHSADVRAPPARADPRVCQYAHEHVRCPHGDDAASWTMPALYIRTASVPSPGSSWRRASHPGHPPSLGGPGVSLRWWSPQQTCFRPCGRCLLLIYFRGRCGEGDAGARHYHYGLPFDPFVLHFDPSPVLRFFAPRRTVRLLQSTDPSWIFTSGALG
jgi:hypothetical protein